jgi:queuine/archaeosine tRNA-ribosyltransferase
MLLSWANVHFYQELMQEARNAIGEKRYAEFAAKLGAAYPPCGEEGEFSGR